MMRPMRTVLVSCAILLGGTALSLAETAAGQPGSGAGRDPAAQQTMCEDHYARQIGQMAYLEARLDLTAPQKPLWERWKTADLAAADKMRGQCKTSQAPAAGATLTLPERQAQMQKMLATRLQGLEATQAPLTALYDALTPAQRTILDKATRHGGHGHGHGHGYGPGGAGEGGQMMSHPGMGNGMGPGAAAPGAGR